MCTGDAEPVEQGFVEASCLSRRNWIATPEGRSHWHEGLTETVWPGIPGGILIGKRK